LIINIKNPKTQVKRQIKKLQHPNAVFSVKIDNAVIIDDIIETNILYICLYLGIIFISTLFLIGFGVDTLSAFSRSVTTMGNVGPNFGIVSSLGNFSQIPTIEKWILTSNMLLGRLEIFGLILFFMIKSWE